MNRVGLKTDQIVRVPYENSSGKGRRIRLTLCFLYAFFAICISMMFSFRVLADNAYTPIVAQIPVRCEKVVNDTSSVYTIRMESIKTGSPLPANDTIVVKNDGTGFFDITVTEPGTYEYRIYQNKGSVNKMQYDEKEYDVYLCVVNNDNGALTYTVSVTLANSAQKPDKVEFTNKLIQDNPPVIIPPVDPSVPPTGTPGGKFSSKTGENTMLRAGIFVGAIGVLVIGAVVYIILKNKKEKTKEVSEQTEMPEGQ